MKQQIGYILTFTAFLTIAVGCEKNVDIKIDEIETMIVMNGLLTADSSVNIYLSRTRHILDNKEIDVLKDALVYISDVNGNTDTLIYTAENTYKSQNLILEPGKEYKVSAKKDGFSPVEASSVIPQKVNLNSVDTSSIVDEWGEKQIAFEVVFDDPPGVENYYMLSVRSNRDVAYTDFFYYKDTLYVDLEKDTVVIGYRRDSTTYVQTYDENVWFESENLAIEQWDYNSNRIIFSDRLFDGKTYSIKGSFYTWFLYDIKDSATVYVSLQSIDYHYFKYLDSRQDHYYAKDDFFAVPVVVHSNVENGVGVLGGMAADTYSFKIAPRKYEWEYYPEIYVD